MSRKIAALIISFILVFMGCESPHRSQDLAEKYIEKLKNKDYEGMYSMLSEEFAKKTPRTAFISWNKEINNKLGSINSFKKTSSMPSSSPEGPETSFSYDLYCTKGKATLNILVLKKGNKLSVSYVVISYS